MYGSEKINLLNPPPPPNYVLSVKGIPFASPGNIILLSAPPKAGKSTLCALLAAAALNPDADICGLKSEFNLAKRLVWIDTEQSEYYATLQFQRAALLSKLTKEQVCQNAEFYTYRNVSLSNRPKLLIQALNEIKNGLVIVDGIGDFLIEGINDEKAAVKFVNQLLLTAQHTNNVLLLTLHANANGLARGWLGAEILRKCETNLTIKPKNGGFVIDFIFTRNLPPPSFSFFLGLDNSLTTDKIEKIKTEKYGIDFWTKIFLNENELTPSELKARLTDKGISPAAAFKIISRAKSDQILNQTAKGKKYIFRADFAPTDN